MLLEILSLLMNQRPTSPGLTNCKLSVALGDLLASLTIQGKR